jgi:hypothetical protein
LYLGPRLVLPQGDTSPALAITYLHHALVGLWISWLGPLAFIRLKVASAGDLGLGRAAASPPPEAHSEG